MPFIKIPGFVEHAGQIREKETERKRKATEQNYCVLDVV